MFLRKGEYMGDAKNDELTVYLREKITNTVGKCEDIDILMYLEKFCRLYIEKNTKKE